MENAVVICPTHFYVGAGLLSALILFLLVKVVLLDRRLKMVETGTPSRRPSMIILVRHGESAGNVDVAKYKTIPDHQIDLTDRGLTQAEDAGKKLAKIIGDRPVFCYVSPYTRTRQTAQGILRSISSDQVIQHREDPRIREQEFAGSFQDENPSTELRRKYSRFFFRFKGGESGADVFDRVSLFLDTLYRDFRHPAFTDESVVLIVTHGLTMRLFLMRWLHWTVEMFNRTQNPHNCAFVVLERQKPDRFQQPFYRLTKDSLRQLGLKTDELAESVPETWVRIHRQSSISPNHSSGSTCSSPSCSCSLLPGSNGGEGNGGGGGGNVVVTTAAPAEGAARTGSDGTSNNNNNNNSTVLTRSASALGSSNAVTSSSSPSSSAPSNNAAAAACATSPSSFAVPIFKEENLDYHHSPADDVEHRVEITSPTKSIRPSPSTNRKRNTSDPSARAISPSNAQNGRNVMDLTSSLPSSSSSSAAAAKPSPAPGSSPSRTMSDTAALSRRKSAKNLKNSEKSAEL